MEKDCFDCRYFECESFCCQKLWKACAIFDTETSANKCYDFVKGEYNEELIEKEYTYHILF